MKKYKDIIIMRGLPGSGKSTKAKSIMDYHLSIGINCIICSTDNFFMINGEYKFVPEQLEYNHKLNINQFKTNCARVTKIIIVDNTNTTWKEINPYVDIGHMYGYNIYIVESNTDWLLMLMNVLIEIHIQYQESLFKE